MGLVFPTRPNTKWKVKIDEIHFPSSITRNRLAAAAASQNDYNKRRTHSTAYIYVIRIQTTAGKIQKKRMNKKKAVNLREMRNCQLLETRRASDRWPTGTILSLCTGSLRKHRARDDDDDEGSYQRRHIHVLRMLYYTHSQPTSHPQGGEARGGQSYLSTYIYTFFFFAPTCIYIMVFAKVPI